MADYVVAMTHPRSQILETNHHMTFVVYIEINMLVVEH